MIDNVFEQQAETESDEEMDLEDEIMDDMDEGDDSEDSDDDDTDDDTDDDSDGDSDEEEMEVSCAFHYISNCLRVFLLNEQKLQIRLGHLDDFDSIAESHDDDDEEISSDSEESDAEDESQEGMEEGEGVDQDEEDFFDQVEADIREDPDAFGVDDDMVRLRNPRCSPIHSLNASTTTLTMLLLSFLCHSPLPVLPRRSGR